MPASRATTGNASQARAGERSGCTRPRYRLDPRALPNSSAKHTVFAPIQMRIKPAFSKLTAAAIALVVLAWGFWLADTLAPPPVAERCETQDCWNAVAEGTLNLTPAPTPAMILGYFVAPLLLTAVALGLTGLIRSTRRPLGVLGLVLPVGTIVLMLLPKLLMLLAITAWACSRSRRNRCEQLRLEKERTPDQTVGGSFVILVFRRANAARTAECRRYGSNRPHPGCRCAPRRRIR